MAMKLAISICGRRVVFIAEILCHREWWGCYSAGARGVFFLDRRDKSENNDTQRSNISKGGSLEEIADYWDTHSLADHWEQTHEVEFEVRAPRRITLFTQNYKKI